MKSLETEDKFNRRKEIGFAIMDALEDLGFDTPDNFYEVDGDKTSNWVIYAKSPTGSGDIEMKIDLQGQVDLDVQNELHEGDCISSLKGLQKKLQDADVDLEVTDWGRVKDLVESEKKQRVVIQEKERVRERLGRREVK